MKNFIIVILTITHCTFLVCSEMIQWSSPALCKNKEIRRKYFEHIALRKNNGEESPEIEYHIPNRVINKNCSNDWGVNWSYNGPLEKWVQRIIGDLDNQKNPLHVVIPGCGKGRDLIDFFVKTRYANIVGIDISAEEKNYFENTMENSNIKTNRLKIVNQDFRDYLKQSKNSMDKVNFYYMVNFIHFFTLQEIKIMLRDIKNSLDDDGLVFLSWHGYDPLVGYSFPSNSTWKEKMLETQYKNNIKDPGYIAQEERNYISLENMQSIAQKIGFCIVHSQPYKTEYIGLDIYSLQKIIFFDYAFLPYTKEEILTRVPICQMILGK